MRCTYNDLDVDEAIPDDISDHKIPPLLPHPERHARDNQMFGGGDAVGGAFSVT